MEELLGKVPFLNGGLFDVHDLERDNPEISIPDAAFERIFDFSTTTAGIWTSGHTKTTTRSTPMSSGYIFEKYVNQKQMGAYYTKEDITGYISRNTIIPFLFDAAKKECPVAFGQDGGVWRLLRDDPDRYIYPAVGHGIVWNARKTEVPKRLKVPFDLPDHIAAGIKDVSQRAGWNAPAPDNYALPTETWREVVARRQRFEEARAKLAAGEVQEVNDLITLNLDVEQFAIDVITQSEGPELLRAFWYAIHGNTERGDTGVSVLDPTCGSGAFLFAALNVLEPLYTVCLKGMRGFLDDAKRPGRERSPEHLSDFRRILERVEKHPNQPYFILKSIVLNNLYGVDIMEEAVEICKLRLFLKLVAQLQRYDQIEPLPDIDFNVRAGNTLIGFTSLKAVRDAMTVLPNGQSRQIFPEEQAALDRINEEAETASAAFDQFRWQQTILGGEVPSADKHALRGRLRSLDDELDCHLAREHGIDIDNADAYGSWRASHQPIHWFVEFYGIMSTGGFDVVIGNPPYVGTKNLSYAPGDNMSARYPDVYAYVLLRSMRIVSKNGRCGMILPLSIAFSRDFATLREEIHKWGSTWLSSFDNIPAALFSGVSQRCTVALLSPHNHHIYSTRLYRWRSQFRTSLMANVSFTQMRQDLDVGTQGFPRLTNRDGERMLLLHSQVANMISASHFADGRHSGILGFSSTARNFISTYVESPPTLKLDGTIVRASRTGSSLKVASRELAFACLAATSGATCFWYWLTRGDGFHVTNSLLSDYLAPLSRIDAKCLSNLRIVGELIHEHRNKALVFKKNAGKYVGNFNYQHLSDLTIRADLLFLYGIGANWNDAESLLSFSALVRGLNEAAGEKNIPKHIKARFAEGGHSKSSEDNRLAEIDRWLAQAFGESANRIAEVGQI